MFFCPPVVREQFFRHKSVHVSILFLIVLKMSVANDVLLVSKNSIGILQVFTTRKRVMLFYRFFQLNKVCPYLNFDFVVLEH